MNVGNCFPIPGKIETEVLTVVLLQMSVAVEACSLSDVDKNIDKVFTMIDRASIGMAGFDLVVTPENILNGFGTNFMNAGITKEGPQMHRLKEKCRELKIWGVFGAFMDFEDGGFVRNCAITINDEGEIVNIYEKTNPWLPGEPSTAGDEIQVFDGPKGAKMATIVCADGDYQETWREASEKGATVIFRISDYMTPYQEAFEITNRAGAYFNRTYVVATNTCEFETGYCSFGRSMVVNPEGSIITQAPEGIPYIIKADLYPGLCEHIRKNAAMGDLNWQSRHRGSASPDNPGTGKDMEMYTYLKK